MTGVPFIAIEGPIGVGKTSLTDKIAAQFNLSLLKEIVEENPFLEKFYDDIDAWSFQTEMFFLCNRYKQLEDTQANFLSQNKPVVSDYHIMKNMIFAKRTLKGEQLSKYEEIYRILTQDMVLPNVMIYIDASLETLLKRIKLRHRQVEENISTAYLAQLRLDYLDFMDQFEKEHTHMPVVRINGDELDFIKRPEDLQVIYDKIKRYV